MVLVGVLCIFRLTGHRPLSLNRTSMAATFSSIAVIGAGVMGRGIALVALRAGYPVRLFDLSESALTDARAYMEKFLAKSVEKGKLAADAAPEIMGRLQVTTELNSCVAPLLIEAVPERLALKHQVLSQLAAVNDEACVLASNTSTLPITRIAAGVPQPQRVIGLHFFNPAPLMKLVEVIAGLETEPVLVQDILTFARELGKSPVLAQDEPGFIVNRVARQYYLEALRCAEDQMAAPAAIDRIMEAIGFRMGPFRLMDLIGVETNHAVSQSMYEAFFQAEKFRPSRLQQKMVDAGRHGRKTGRGFYEY